MFSGQTFKSLVIATVVVCCIFTCLSVSKSSLNLAARSHQVYHLVWSRADAPSNDPPVQSKNIDIKMEDIPANGTRPTVSIIMMHRFEDLSWVPYDFGRVFIYERHQSDHPIHTDRCREVPAYLQYIIDHYDDLTDLNIFVHAHHGSWHSPNMLIRLQWLNLTQALKRGYVNFQMEMDDTYVIPNTTEGGPPVCSDCGIQVQAWYLARLLEDCFIDELGHRPTVVRANCCAQFAVARRRIRNRPLEFYKRLMKWVEEGSQNDEYSSRAFEYAWHIIFGEPDYSVTTTTCEIFGQNCTSETPYVP